MDEPLTFNRVVEFTADFVMPESFTESLVWAERDFTITLPEGETWPPEMTPGRAVNLRFDLPDSDYRVNGRLLFRRGRSCVIRGQLTQFETQGHTGVPW